MVIPQNIIEKLQFMCRQNLKEEICGIITSDLDIIPIRNVASVKTHCFIFDKREYVEAMKDLQKQSKSILCFYHSHPGASPEPSDADCRFILKSRTSALIVTATGYKFVEYRDA